jgi:hypothetical protein
MVRVGGYLLLAFVFFTALSGVHDWLWGHHERIGITGMASGVGLFAFVVFQLVRGRIGRTPAAPLDPTPVGSLMALVAGTWAKTMGTARPKQGLLPIPLAEGSCAWSRVRVVVMGAVVAEMRTADVLELEDGGGNAVELDVRDADVELRTRRSFTTSAERPNPQVVDYLAQRALARGERDVEIVVEWIPIRELVFATGRVEEATTSGGYRDPHACQRRLVPDGARRVRVSSA